MWIVQDAAPVLTRSVVEQVEDAARISEEFFGEAFPTTDIIVLVVSKRGEDFGELTAHYGSHMSVVASMGELYGVPHETAHYYFQRNFEVNKWFTEGGANFLEAQFHDRRGNQDLEARRSEVSEGMQINCIAEGVENIRHNSLLVELGEIPRDLCTYAMGEDLMFKLFEVLGMEGMSSALNELYVASRGHVPALRFSTPPAEAEIFETFLKHTPEEKQDEVRELFRTLHGGAFAFPEIDTEDVEADEPADAPLLVIGETVEGSLDYIFDFDYFRFQAEKGQRYRIGVDHEELGHTSITIYGPDGETEERGRWKGRGIGPRGPLILWQAPSSREYYFAVQNFGGKSGDYTFSIVPVEVPERDDHGDTPETATKIRTGQSVTGTIEHDFDYDYFRFSAAEDEEFFFEIHEDSYDSPCIVLHNKEVSVISNWYNECDGISRTSYAQGYRLHWRAPQADEYFIAFYGFTGRIGIYEFEIEAVN